MIIDFHTHVFPDRIAAKTIEVLSEASQISPASDGTAQGLSRSMQRAGISLSINLPVLTNPAQADKVNDSLLKGREQMLEMGILPFAGMHPGYENYLEKLRMLTLEGVKGIKLHPAYQRTDIDDPAMMRIIDAASELGLIVLIHAGQDIGIPGHDYSDVPMILRVLEEVRPEKMVLAHMGGWKNWEDVRRDIAGAPVWLDTAFSIGRIDTVGEEFPEDAYPEDSPSEDRPAQDSPSDAAPDRSGQDMRGAEFRRQKRSPYGQWCPGPSVPDGSDPEESARYNLSETSFVSLCRTHGTDRILFGTDCPWADQKAYLEAVRALPFTDEEMSAILGGNAEKLLCLTT